MVSYYLAILRQRFWLILGVAALFAPLIFLALTFGEKTYSSTAVIQVGTGDVAEDLVETSGGYEEPERRIATELEVLTGRQVAESAAARLREDGVAISVDDLVGRVTASPRGQASAIEVVGTATEPELAQLMTRAYIDSYIDYRRDVNRDELERVRSDLQKRLAATAAAGDSQRRYDTLAEWLEGVTLRLSVDTSGVKLISPASLPEEPTAGTSPVVAGVVAVLGALLLGCAEALLIDLVRGSVRTREDAEALVPAPSLVEMPRVRGDSSQWAAAISDPSHPTTAAARGLRLRLGSAGTSGDARRIMVVGTEQDGVDTLTVASALAATYGRANLQVLLVADGVRGADVEELLDADEEGLLNGEVPLSSTVLPGVWVAPATAVAGMPGVLDALNPADVLESSRSFDVVVLSMPPTVDDAEAVAVGHLAQAIVVVCALGRTPAKRLRRLVASLERNGSIVSGLALTSKASRSGFRGSRDLPARPGRVPVGAA